MTQTTTEYIPGVCNINRAEIAYRRKAGYVGIAIFILLAIVLFILHVSRWSRIILFVPAFVGAIGLLQAKNSFCVAYGAGGQQNAADGSATASAVTDEAARSKDKRKARLMNLQAALSALLAVGILLLVPTI